MAEQLKLHWLFVATLLNGKKIKQTQRDVCPTDPKRSAFWDLVLKDEKGEGMVDPKDNRLITIPELMTFMMVGQGADRKQKFLVSLVDGHFEVDGIRMDYIDNKPLIQPPPFVPLSLIFFRRRREHFTPTTGQHVKSECEYHFGWKAPTGHSQTLILE